MIGFIETKSKLLKILLKFSAANTSGVFASGNKADAANDPEGIMAAAGGGYYNDDGGSPAQNMDSGPAGGLPGVYSFFRTGSQDEGDGGGRSPRSLSPHKSSGEVSSCAGIGGGTINGEKMATLRSRPFREEPGEKIIQDVRTRAYNSHMASIQAGGSIKVNPNLPDGTPVAVSRSPLTLGPGGVNLNTSGHPAAAPLHGGLNANNINPNSPTNPLRMGGTGALSTAENMKLIIANLGVLAVSRVVVTNFRMYLEVEESVAEASLAQDIAIHADLLSLNKESSKELDTSLGSDARSERSAGDPKCSPATLPMNRSPTTNRKPWFTHFLAERDYLSVPWGAVKEIKQGAVPDVRPTGLTGMVASSLETGSQNCWRVSTKDMRQFFLDDLPFAFGSTMYENFKCYAYPLSTNLSQKLFAFSYFLAQKRMPRKPLGDTNGIGDDRKSGTDQNPGSESSMGMVGGVHQHRGEGNNGSWDVQEEYINIEGRENTLGGKNVATSAGPADAATKNNASSVDDSGFHSGFEDHLGRASLIKPGSSSSRMAAEFANNPQLGWQIYDAQKEFRRILSLGSAAEVDQNSSSPSTPQHHSRGTGPGTSPDRKGLVSAINSDPACPWVVSSVNHRYELCETYPSVLVVPKRITVPELVEVAGYRKKRRIPSMSWCGGKELNYAAVFRSSQTTEGLFGNVCNADQRYRV